MEVPAIYAIIFSSLLCLCFSRTLINERLSVTQSPLWSSWRRKIVRYLYPIAVPRTRFTPAWSRIGLAGHLTYWAGTSLFNFLNVHSLEEAAARAGSMATFTLVLLLLGDRLAFTAKVFRISQRFVLQCHKSFGVMFVVQITGQTILAYVLHGIHLSHRIDIYGLITAASAVSSLILAMPFPRNYAYEFFLVAHKSLGILIVFFAWQRGTSSLERVFLISAVSVYALSMVGRYLRFLFRNVLWNSSWTPATTKLEKSGDAVILELGLVRPWKLLAGDWVFLWMPSISLTSVFESHPFSIMWWDEDCQGKATRIWLMVKPCYGFTSCLASSIDSERHFMFALDGPYGQALDTLQYQNVLLFATGSGIAALIPVVKQIFKERLCNRSSVRRILLVWQISKEREESWVFRWLNKLLKTDGLDPNHPESKKEPIFHIALYITGGFRKKETRPGHFDDSNGTRVKTLYSRVDVAGVFEQELKILQRHGFPIGTTLITVSASPKFRDEVRKQAFNSNWYEAHLHEMDFQPPEPGGFWRLTEPQTREIGVIGRDEEKFRNCDLAGGV